MKNRKLREILFISLLATIGAAGGCATVEGIGEDVQSAGEGIEGAAEDASN
ncbi:MAG: entericidin A/B family lipoprotein [Alteromonadaceae bacterium]|nr:entericidin A/B family lipoprotein [Alteromonadaceae bacterium]